jgi:CBS domain-containing protein
MKLNVTPLAGYWWHPQEGEAWRVRVEPMTSGEAQAVMLRRAAVVDVADKVAQAEAYLALRDEVIASRISAVEGVEAEDDGQPVAVATGADLVRVLRAAHGMAAAPILDAVFAEIMRAGEGPSRQPSEPSGDSSRSAADARG